VSRVGLGKDLGSELVGDLGAVGRKAVVRLSDLAGAFRQAGEACACLDVQGEPTALGRVVAGFDEQCLGFEGVARSQLEAHAGPRECDPGEDPALVEAPDVALRPLTNLLRILR
jgi:hypothetical protein